MKCFIDPPPTENGPVYASGPIRRACTVRIGRTWRGTKRSETGAAIVEVTADHYEHWCDVELDGTETEEGAAAKIGAAIDNAWRDGKLRGEP